MRLKEFKIDVRFFQKFEKIGNRTIFNCKKTDDEIFIEKFKY